MFRWLQSLEDRDLAFVVIDPCQVDADYPIDLVRKHLGFRLEEEDCVVLALCTIPPRPAKPTVTWRPSGSVSSRRRAPRCSSETKYEARTEFCPRAPPEYARDARRVPRALGVRRPSPPDAS